MSESSSKAPSGLLGMFAKVLQVVRLKPHETETSEGRGRERARRVAMTALTSFVVRGVSMLSIVLTVPATTGYLGPDRYGVWTILSSTMVFVGFADLGLGLGLMNTIAGASGRDSREEMADATSTTFFLLCVSALVALLLVVVTVPSLPWQALLKVNASVAKEFATATTVIALCFAFGLPFSIVQRVQSGLQQGLQSNIWQAIGVACSTVLLLTAIHFHSSMPVLAACVFAMPAVINVVNFLHFFGTRDRDIRPRFSKFQREKAWKILHVGFSFFLLTAGYQFAYAFDNGVFSNAAGPAAVGIYGVCSKLFGFVIVLNSVATTPFWPAFAEANSRGDLEWVRRTYKRLWKVIFAVCTVSGLILIPTGSKIIYVWTRHQYDPSLLLVVGTFLWAVNQSCQGVFGSFLGGLTKLKVQAIVFAVYGVLSLPVQWYCAKIWRAEGFAMGSFAVAVLLMTLPLAIACERVMAGLKSNEASVPDVGSGIL